MLFIMKLPILVLLLTAASALCACFYEPRLPTPSTPPPTPATHQLDPIGSLPDLPANFPSFGYLPTRIVRRLLRAFIRASRRFETWTQIVGNGIYGPSTGGIYSTPLFGRRQSMDCSCGSERCSCETARIYDGCVKILDNHIDFMEQCPTTHLAQARAYVCASFDVEHRETMAIDSAGRRRRVSMECWCGEKENCLCANANNEQRTTFNCSSESAIIGHKP